MISDPFSWGYQIVLATWGLAVYLGVMPPLEYKSFIRAARSHATRSERAQVQLMQLLVLVFNTPSIWKKHHTTWEALLKAERFCTLGKFRAFKKGLSLKLPVQKLGVDATCLLASYPTRIRSKAKEKTLIWVNQNKVAPTYQRVAEYVKGFAPKPKRVTVAMLRQYIVKLQKICDKNQISYPKAPLPCPTKLKNYVSCSPTTG